MIRHDLFIKQRIEHVYSPASLVRFGVIGILYSAGALLFPRDFMLLSENAAYLFTLYALGTVGHVVAMVVFRAAVTAPDFPQRAERIRDAEADYSYATTLAFALLIPAAHRYYGNMLWFVSAFFYSQLLANPFISRRKKQIAIVSPPVGFLLHTAITTFRFGPGFHPPALLFTVLVSGLLWYMDGLFERTNIFALLSHEDSAGVDRFIARYELSDREGEVLGHLLRGHDLKSIGTALFVSTNTIKTHVRNIYRKTGTHSRTELFSEFTRFRLREPESGSGARRSDQSDS